MEKNKVNGKKKRKWKERKQRKTLMGRRNKEVWMKEIRTQEVKKNYILK